jgi:ATP-dependent DNA ligase
VCLDEAGKPIFNDLLFRRREPVYVAFDVLTVEGADVKGMPLKDRRAILDRVVMRYTGLVPFTPASRPQAGRPVSR